MSFVPEFVVFFESNQLGKSYCRFINLALNKNDKSKKSDDGR